MIVLCSNWLGHAHKVPTYSKYRYQNNPAILEKLLFHKLNFGLFI